MRPHPYVRKLLAVLLFCNTVAPGVCAALCQANICCPTPALRQAAQACPKPTDCCCRKCESKPSNQPALDSLPQTQGQTCCSVTVDPRDGLAVFKTKYPAPATVAPPPTPAGLQTQPDLKPTTPRLQTNEAVPSHAWLKNCRSRAPPVRP